MSTNPVFDALTINGSSTLNGGGTCTGTFAGTPTWSGLHFFSGGLKFSGGSNVAGSIYTDNNWGCLIRGKTGSAADVGLQANDGSVSVRALTGTAVQLGFVSSVTTTQTLSGTTRPPFMANFAASWAGTSTRSDNSSIATLNVGTTSDNAAFPNAGGSRSEILVASNYGGNNFSGGRVGFFTQMNWTTASTVAHESDGLTGIAGVVTSNVNVGGTSSGFGVSNFGMGSLFGANPWAKLQSGATFFKENVGIEVDASVGSGASVNSYCIAQFVATSDHATQGTVSDNGIAVLAQVGASAGIRNLVRLGGYGSQWPVDANGYLIQAVTGQNNISVAAAAAGGIDFVQVAFSGSGAEGGNFAFRSPGPSGVGATAIDGSGGVKIGTGYINASSAGLIIDVPLYALSGTPTVVSGGSNYGNNDIVSDAFGNVFRVTAAAGVVSAVTVMARSEGSASDHSGTVSTTARSRTGSQYGSGLTLSETWAQSSKGLSLNPTGQKVGFNGTSPISKPTVTGSKGANAALTSLLTALANYGLITDSTT